MSRRHRAKQRIERALSVVKAFSIAVPGAVEIQLDVEAASGVADSGDPEQDLADLFREIGEVAQANQMGALFLIDEMQNLDAASLSPPSAWRSRPSAAPGCRSPWWEPGCPTSGSAFCRPSPTPTASSPTPSWVGSPTRPPAPPWSAPPRRPASTSTRRRPARSCTEAAGFPYFIQEYGRELWNYAERTPITVADLDGARDIVQDSLARNFFGTRFEMATDTEQRYLSAMASLGEGPYPVGEVAQAFGVNDQRRVSMHRESLIQKGLIWSPRRGQVDFTVPLFAAYLKENHPIG